MSMLQISLYVSKNSKFKIFASLKSSGDYTIAFGNVFLNSYSLSHCISVFSHNHAILQGDNLFNNEAQEFFSFHTILHQHPRNTYHCISKNC